MGLSKVLPKPLEDFESLNARQWYLSNIKYNVPIYLVLYNWLPERTQPDSS